MWHIELKHTFYKSRREEWTLRLWKPIKYHRPVKPPKFYPMIHETEIKNDAQTT